MSEKTAQQVNMECQRSLDELKALLEGKKPEPRPLVDDIVSSFEDLFGIHGQAQKRPADNY